MKPEVFVVESRSPEETQHLGEHLARGCYAGLSLLLRGDLGSGKTEMARGFLAHLGYGRVRSPSFSLVHEYPTTPLVVHVDLYRLPEQQDLEDLGLEEYLLRGAVLLVEWPERWKSPPQENLWEVEFAFCEALLTREFSLETTRHRKITLRAWGSRAQVQLCRVLKLFCPMNDRTSACSVVLDDLQQISREARGDGAL